MTRRGAALAVLAGAAAWGTTGTSQAVADLTLAPPLVGAARLVAGALVLAVVVAVRARTGMAVGPTRPPRPRDVLGPVLLAGTAVAGYQFAFFAAVDRAGVAVGTVVAIGSSPVLTGLIAWLVDRVRPSGRWWTATVLAIVGCVLVARPGADDAAIDPLGVLLALTAGLSYAVLVVAQGRVVATGLPPLRGLALVIGVGAVPGTVLLLAGDAGALLSARGLALVAWLGLVTVGLGHLLWVLGVARLPAPTVGTLTLSEPLVAAALGIVVLGERPTTIAVLGAALLVVGLVLVTLPTRAVVTR